MTELLKKAFEQASKLPPKEQDAFAALVLAELEADAKWDHFAASHEMLETLADDARADLRAGRSGASGPREALISRRTPRFHKAFEQLPLDVQEAARTAFQLFTND